MQSCLQIVMAPKKACPPTLNFRNKDLAPYKGQDLFSQEITIEFSGFRHGSLEQVSSMTNIHRSLSFSL
ncbi:hypothetical protein SAMN05444008_105146 [Cnuella takakiae]|uniref:Uncharacterized protein n=1 Tax=Cnuella takakiae TaxID=1302690 RepID=A0A1M4Z9Z0_9BACT|nr:hypothetical protein SAMN05444008_105146 [Cnuella takakiae]